MTIDPFQAIPLGVAILFLLAAIRIIRLSCRTTYRR